jgi:hypothetical protein
MKTLLFGFTAFLLAVSTASADVHVSMQNGRVTIIAKDATVRQILTEWARVGQTKIVNVERIPGGPMTLELRDVPEAQALDVLLRSLSGYIAAPRAAVAANLSQFDRIIVMPTVASARPATNAPPPPVFNQSPQFNQQQVIADDDTDDERPQPNVAVPPARGPVFNSFPQPQVVNPQGGAPAAYPGQPPSVGVVPQPGQQQQMPQQAAPPANTASPTSPFGGVSVPGMIVQPPQQPGQPGQIQPPAQPGQQPPVRRPGGNDEGQ